MDIGIRIIVPCNIFFVLGENENRIVVVIFTSPKTSRLFKQKRAFSNMHNISIIARVKENCSHNKWNYFVYSNVSRINCPSACDSVCNTGTYTSPPSTVSLL